MKITSLTILLGITLLTSLPAIASERYPTNSEIKRLIREFQQRAVSKPISGECCGGYESDSRTPAQKRPLESFVGGWKKVNPDIAPFLGHWINNDADIFVYPSKTKGQVCVVWGLMDPRYVFSLGNYSNGVIRLSNGELNRTVLITQRNPKGNPFLLLATVSENRALAEPGSDVYAYPKLPPSFKSFVLKERPEEGNQIIRQLNAAGCSYALPQKSSLAQNKQQANQKTIESLPDGEYFYGNLRLPNKNGGQYIIFQKLGNILTGERYDYPTAGSCFRGQISGNLLTNITEGYLKDGFDEESGYQFTRSEKNWNFNSYYRLNFQPSPEGKYNGLKRCSKAFI
jgi:hypothetical protein